MPIIRVNLNAFEEGEDYLNNLNQEADRNLQIFFALLSSYWQSSIDGPNYAREIKAMSIALAKIRLSLDQVRTDTYYKSLRSEYLYQVLTSILFPDVKGAPDPQFADLDFRDFLQKIVTIYFAGSIPDSMKSAVELFTTGAEVVVKENYAETRNPASGFDISDEFGFDIDIILPSPSTIDVFLADKNIRLLLDIIRPAHTLYRLRYVLQDEYIGKQTGTQPNKIIDELGPPPLNNFVIHNYGYEDFRKFIDGVEGVDLFGAKKVIYVTGEDDSSQFI
jgi:hypothetical protein